ncbi:hypothetical protein, partial [Klebsiella pneumoniae]|uniref:hypothetical protein n=1 Tax=Klebsiella pneumoniae TaxID=573 RepID=UPI0039C02860
MRVGWFFLIFILDLLWIGIIALCLFFVCFIDLLIVIIDLIVCSDDYFIIVLFVVFFWFKECCFVFIMF